MAAAAADVIADLNAGLMSDYLENTIGVGNIILRSRLAREGFTNNLGFLSSKDDKYVTKVASSIRKQGGAVGGLMTVNLEETLTHFVRWTRCTHLTQRNLDFADATIDNITAVGVWMEQLLMMMMLLYQGSL